MSAQITKIPNRNELIQEQEEQARLFLRGFNPRRYSTFYSRIYNVDAYLSQIGVEVICELLEHAGSLMGVARKLDISTPTLRNWIGKNAARVNQIRQSYIFAGEGFAHKAEEVLRNAIGGTREEVALAGKLSDHYRWMASRLDREKFGEAAKVDPSAGRAPMSITLNFGGAEAPKEQLVKAAPLVADFLRLTDEE